MVSVISRRFFAIFFPIFTSFLTSLHISKTHLVSSFAVEKRSNMVFIRENIQCLLFALLMSSVITAPMYYTRNGHDSLEPGNEKNTQIRYIQRNSHRIFYGYFVR